MRGLSLALMSGALSLEQQPSPSGTSASEQVTTSGEGHDWHPADVVWDPHELVRGGVAQDCAGQFANFVWAI